MADYKAIVVDDDELTRGMLEDWLRSAGYSVATAANGADGLAALAQWQPDVVITDLSMPVMDGFEFCKQIRETSDVPILVFSGSVEKQALRSSMELGADGYAVKNIGMTEFLKLVKRLAASGRKQVRHGVAAS